MGGGGDFLWRPHQGEKWGGAHLWFPLCRDEAGLLVTPMYGYFCDSFPLVPAVGLFSPLSSSSAFLRSLLTQSSHLSCDLPRFLQPSCFLVADIFGHLSSFILTMCPAHFIRLLTILPTMQALVPTSSRRSFILRLSTLHTPAILLIQLFSHIQVCVDAVRTELTSPCHMY